MRRLPAYSRTAELAAEKRDHPERFCKVRGCRWRVLIDGKSVPCGRHDRQSEFYNPFAKHMPVPVFPKRVS